MAVLWHLNDYPTVFNDFIASVELTYISGTVTDELDNPLVRQVLLLNEDGGTLFQQVNSNVDGTYTFEVNAGPSEKFTVIASGHEGENHKIFTHVTAV